MTWNPGETPGFVYVEVEMIKVGDLVQTNNWYFIVDSPETVKVMMDDATSPAEIYMVTEIEDRMCRIVLPGGDLQGWIDKNKLMKFDRFV